MNIFVYGTLKKTYGNNALLRDAIYLGKALTVQPMRLVGDGIPFAWADKNGRSLQGEVYDIGDIETDNRAQQRLASLDRLESNGSFYERKVHKVRMIEDAQGIKPLPRNQGDILDAWVYEIMNPERYYKDGRYQGGLQENRFFNDSGAIEWHRNNSLRFLV